MKAMDNKDDKRKTESKTGIIFMKTVDTKDDTRKTDRVKLALF